MRQIQDAKILLVDDNRELLELLRETLSGAGYRSLAAAETCAEARAAFAGWQPDFMVLDINLPDGDGFALFRELHAKADIPALFLSARDEDSDRLFGLGLGADDYLTKPFRVAELRARVAAHLRRQNRTPSHKITRGGVTLDLSAKEAGVGGTPLHLTKSEYAICELLALHAGQTFSKEQIYEAVFGYDGTADDTAITQHIKNIRAKLRAAGAGEVLQTIWGVGYQWQNEN